MARRLSLAERAERSARLLSRDLGNLPKTARRELERLTDAIGISVEQFIAYKPSTRKRYIQAAKKGRTAAQERERVRTQRVERAKRKRFIGGEPDPRRVEIERLRRWLDERVDTSRGNRTVVDDIEADVLLSPDSIESHISVYGVDYTLRQLRGMKAGYDELDTGQSRWRSFKASEAIPDHPDERWYWYHGRIRLVNAIDFKLLR